VIWEEIDDVEIEVEEFDDLFSKAPPKPKEVKVRKLKGFKRLLHSFYLFRLYIIHSDSESHSYSMVHSFISIRRVLSPLFSLLVRSEGKKLPWGAE
jgi:hypothetical protein